MKNVKEKKGFISEKTEIIFEYNYGTVLVDYMKCMYNGYYFVCS